MNMNKNKQIICNQKVQGKKHGLWKYYFENKVLQSEGIYRYGKEDKEWKYYNIRGVQEWTINYFRGKRQGWTTKHSIGEKYYYENGEYTGKREETKRTNYE